MESRVPGRRDPVLDDPIELLGGHAGVSGREELEAIAGRAGEDRLEVAVEHVAERRLFLPLGMLAARALTRSRAKATWL